VGATNVGVGATNVGAGAVVCAFCVKTAAGGGLLKKEGKGIYIYIIYTKFKIFFEKIDLH
jgi:hypothetical protein